jgi:predicted hydrocarbon binding protein
MKKKKQMDTGMYMPAEAIKSLRMELANLLKEKLAKGVLFRFGYRCGEALVEGTGSENPKKLDLVVSLPKIWKQTGLGSINKIEEVSENELEIEITDSMEAKVLGKSDVPSCDYTRGYLAGICSSLSKKKFYAIETECETQNRSSCKFNLVVFPHRVYVPKKTS